MLNEGGGVAAGDGCAMDGQSQAFGNSSDYIEINRECKRARMDR